MNRVEYQEALQKTYDVLIVGGGFAAAILARSLSEAGRSILVLEAGAGHVDAFEEHVQHVKTYMKAGAKIPNSPFPMSPNAPQPLVTDVQPIRDGQVDIKGYFVQKGPYPFESTYTRRVGGTSLHWFGSCPRMLPEDFAMQSNFGRGVDWPWSYDELLPYYAMAEREIGVSANVEDQTYKGIYFEDAYVYPMHRIPPSYLDQWFTQGLEGMVEYEGDTAYEILIRSIPQARNSIPNTAYADGQGYQPIGAVGDPGIGTRCMGNSSCIPICPIQARYNALKSFHRSTGDIVHKAVATRLHFNSQTGRITGVDAKVWHREESPENIQVQFSAPIVILAANAIENAKLLLASDACKSSDQVGRNLMDHPAILSWGYAPQNIGAFRGPGLTSTLVTYRGGEFRKERAAFVFEIGNWGWQWPKNEPIGTVQDCVDQKNLLGPSLRKTLSNQLSRQVRVDLMTEQLPSSENRVTLDPSYRDALGNYRPVLSYNVDAYTRQGMCFGRSFTRRVFERLGIEDHTFYSPDDPGYFQERGQSYAWSGVGHVAGTHRMGTHRKEAVVDRYQRAFDHENLYIVGCGSMPTLGTSNPSLTMAALLYATAEHILKRNDACQV